MLVHINAFAPFSDPSFVWQTVRSQTASAWVRSPPVSCPRGCRGSEWLSPSNSVLASGRSLWRSSYTAAKLWLGTILAATIRGVRQLVSECERPSECRHARISSSSLGHRPRNHRVSVVASSDPGYGVGPFERQRSRAWARCLGDGEEDGSRSTVPWAHSHARSFRSGVACGSTRVSLC